MIGSRRHKQVLAVNPSMLSGHADAAGRPEMNHRCKALTVWLSAALCVSSSEAVAADPLAVAQRRSSGFVGTLSCSSASCHGRTAPLPGGRIGHEYAIWLGSDASL